MTPIFLRKLVLSLAIFAIVALGSATVAMADSVLLTVPNNAAAIGPGPYATVDYVLNGNTIDVTVTGINPYTTFGNGGPMLGFNVVGSTTGLTITNMVNCNLGGVNQNISAFGNFEFSVGDGTPPGVTSFSFTVSRTAGFSSASELFENNAAGFAFAGHIYNPNGPADARTGFAGNGDPSSVPEPASMLLLGAGLIGAAASLRKRLKK